MPRTDKSVTFLTGMIIAALYVILLIGFSRESYMRRDAAALADGAAAPADVPGGWSVTDDASNRMCRIERPVCLPLTPWRAKAPLARGCARSPTACRMIDRLAALARHGGARRRAALPNQISRAIVEVPVTTERR